MKVLRRQAYLDVIGVNAGGATNSDVTPDQTDQWQLKYTQASYVRGQQMADAQLAQQGVEIATDTNQLRALYGITTDEQMAAVLSSTNALHKETIERIQNLAFNDLVQATETMLGQMRATMSKGNKQTPTQTYD